MNIRSYIKVVISYVLSILIGYRFKDYWLAGERGTDARDNAYWMFKYISEQHPEQKIMFLISKDSPDYDKVSKIGECLQPGTIKHGIVFLSVNTIICTHISFCAPAWRGMHFAARHKIMYQYEKRIFLQHGITKDFIPILTYPKLNTDIFISGARPEYEYLCSNYGFPNGVIKYTGFARYDNLFNNKINSKETNKIILLMPTWRVYLSSCKNIEEFKNSEFYLRYNSLINNKQLAEALEKNGYKLIFYPHYEIQKWLDSFTTQSKNIVIASFSNYDVQNLLIQCDFLITDYSSIFFDAAYMLKPIIFYQFDLELYRKTQYQEGYYKYEEGFGPVVNSEEELVKKIVLFMEGYNDEKYLDEEKRFFDLNDNKCCQRIYEAIIGTEKRNKS